MRGRHNAEVGMTQVVEAMGRGCPVQPVLDGEPGRVGGRVPLPTAVQACGPKPR